MEHPAFLIIILALFAVLFGGKRLPEAARGLGRSMRIFKSEVKQMREDEDDETRPRGPIEGKVVDDRSGTTPGTAPRSRTTGTPADDIEGEPSPREQRRGA